MKKLSEYKNEQAIEIMAKLISPLARVFTNAKVKAVYNAGASKIEFIQTLLTECPHEIIETLAILEDTPVDKYEVSFVALPGKLLEILNDEELSDFFESQGQNLV